MMTMSDRSEKAALPHTCSEYAAGQTSTLLKIVGINRERRNSDNPHCKPHPDALREEELIKLLRFTKRKHKEAIASSSELPIITKICVSNVRKNIQNRTWNNQGVKMTTVKPLSRKKTRGIEQKGLDRPYPTDIRRQVITQKDPLKNSFIVRKSNTHIRNMLTMQQSWKTPKLNIIPKVRNIMKKLSQYSRSSMNDSDFHIRSGHSQPSS